MIGAPAGPDGIAVLNESFGLSDALVFETSPLGGPVARLTAGSSTATVALQGAQVLGWRHAGVERLWLSPISRLGTGKAVRGGIPVCWPWFGPHPSDPQKPAHGFVRTRAWTVVGSSRGDRGIALSFATDCGPADQALFPHLASLRLTVILDEALSLQLETRNTGPSPFSLTQALHTYFRVSDIEGARIEGLAGRRYIDKLVGDARMTQVGTIAIGQEVDRIYLGDTSTVTLTDSPADRHRLQITSQGSGSAIVWNPWFEKTLRLGDMGGQQAFRHMLCIETANAGDDVVMLKPGGSHILAARYGLA